MPLPSTPQTAATAFWQGFYEYLAGFEHCPYPEGLEAYAWGLGWRAQRCEDGDFLGLWGRSLPLGTERYQSKAFSQTSSTA